MEKSNIVYGRLAEATHIAGYTFERAMGELKWLLQDNRWMEVGEGFNDIHEFVKSISFAEFKIAIEQRKEIVNLLSEIGTSQRATAKMLGVSKDTIRNDIGDNSPPEENTDIDNQEVINDTGDNSPLPEKSWFEKEGIKVAEREQKNVHVSQNSGENEWYTPSLIIDSARSVMGSIDLDPASSEIANKNIKAEHIFTEKDNGLEKEWSGNVWMNPPYAQPLINKFSEKLVSELSNIKQACVLVNNATETNWLQNMMKECNAICFVKGRVKFIDIKGNASGAPLQGQVILYFGKNIEGFYNNFNEFGICMTKIGEK